MASLFILYSFLFIFFGTLSVIARKSERRERFLKRLNAALNVDKDESMFILAPFLVHGSVMLVLLWINFNIASSFVIAILSAFVPLALRIAGKKKRRRRIDGQIEPFLVNLSSAFFANPSLQHALREAGNETEAPMKNEINKVLMEIEAGAAQNDAFRRMGERIDEEILTMAINGVSICSETGGGLAKYLNRLAGLKRDRARLTGRIAAMSSQQKVTAKIVAMIPLVFLGLIWAANPSFFSYFKSPIGLGVVAYSATSIMAGFIVMNKMTDLFPDI